MKWDFNKIHELALKCTFRSEFKTKYLYAYRAAIRLKILDDICSHMPKRKDISGVNNPFYSWTNDQLRLEALKHNTRDSFRKNCNNAYQVAFRRGILDEICSHMEYTHYPWTNEELYEEALKHSSRIDFARKNNNAYQTAQNRGILDQICAHMKSLHEDWTSEKLQMEALKHKTRKDFYEGSLGAYAAAARRGILDEICKHMKKSTHTSFMELELLSGIKKIFSKAKKIRVTANMPSKPFIKRFELDIVINDRAIEFDGTYHHSFKRMRASDKKKSWPDQDLHDYHLIKDSFFLNYHNIEVLHIKEADWTDRKDYCIKLSIAWLGKNCSIWPKAPQPLDI